MLSLDDLLEMPYWIVDILPRQVPPDAPGQYFAVERYYRTHRREEIAQKKIDLLLKLNCYLDLFLGEDREKNPPPERIAEPVLEQNILIFLSGALITSDPEDTSMTVYHPDEDLLALLRELALGEGLCLWQPEHDVWSTE